MVSARLGINTRGSVLFAQTRAHYLHPLCPPKQETRTEKPYSKLRTAMIRQFSFNHNTGIPKVAFSGFPKPAKLNLGDSGLHF